MMQDKKALQAATSHYFGDRFARAFAIKFQDRTGKEQFVHQTSWGISTRIIGALIMTHSDDQGLVLPPKAAPTEIVIVPILQKNRDNTAVLEAANRLKADLSKRFRVHVDLRDSVSAGFKFHEWEVQGIPLRVELGPRDLAEGKVVLAPRVGEKRPVSLDGAVDAAATILDELQSTLLRRSEAFLKANTFEENDYGKFRTLIEERPGFYSMPWCGSATCETQVKEETKATIRCIPFDRKKTPAKCVVCGSPAEGPVLFARSY
jgi:prolyl-tRNA synthetase